jgi:hypothetical protein
MGRSRITYHAFAPPFAPLREIFVLRLFVACFVACCPWPRATEEGIAEADPFRSPLCDIFPSSFVVPR